MYIAQARNVIVDLENNMASTVIAITQKKVSLPSLS